MGGGGKQNAAQQQQLDLSNQLAQQEQQGQQAVNQQVTPFYQQRSQTGLPYYNNLVDSASGNVAKAFAPGRAQLQQKLGSQNGLPSGFKQGALTDYDEGQSQAFDQQLTGAQAAQEQSKQQGTQGLQGALNPLAYAQQAQGGYGSVINAPRQPGLAGILGGAAQGLAGAIPF
jgi:hypothetical protein